MSSSSSSTADLLARRRRLLAPTYGLFYEEPVHITRASGVWMYGPDGRAYLDVYNNVPVVGHCHPQVVEALAHQAALLNTHTRYLTEKPLELAERLLATFPSELATAIFTCTGSESNDLAIRVSKVATGGTGVIISEWAYHGTTETLAGMSPSSGMGRLGTHVYTVPAPIDQESASQFASRVQACIETMRAAGVKPAALLVDTIFSSDGVSADPPGYLAAAAEHVRAAGGLLIADEVQPGFGRTGHSMWGFQRHGVVPDLVTMGKPMGNGHPVSALIARPEVIAEFARQTRYFNTFGGNTVACAVALAVLDIIEQEQLITNAREIGAQLRRGLQELASRHPTLGAIRGAGLFIGAQITTGKAETTRIVNALRQRGVLIGSAGRNGDVLKIRPPLVFKQEHVDQLLGTLAQVL
ncbi:aspartate aminotransferase family protein [Steroidobacter flavus]|uniref:Aspartate aminotransferase family protein n=1 Tax=Steroidobacter flavus TaxID=1842136 RepID=A0ABV8SKE8_9GAMM